MTEHYIIAYFGDKFVADFTKDNPDYTPTSEQLERFIIKWVFEHAGRLTINEVALVTQYVESKITVKPNSKYGKNKIPLEVIS